MSTPHVQMEEYESLGEIKTFNIDLHKRYKEITEARQIMLEEEDADFVFEIDFPTPPSVTWEWIHDPEKRNIWGGVPDAWSAGDRPGGRSGVGSSNHCAHGNSVSTQVVVDWHPFEYYTTHSFEKGKHTFTETEQFEALPDGGTRVRHAGKMHLPIPRFIRKAALKFVLITQNHFDQMMARAAQLADEEFIKTRADEYDTIRSKSRPPINSSVKL